MRVARLHGMGDLRTADEPEPAVPPGSSLVRVTAMGLCGSDLHWYAEGHIGDTALHRAVVPGHEFAGVVEGGPRHGERVAVDPAVPCGTCELCQEGHRNLCPTVGFAGHGERDGACQELLAWPTHLLHPLPDTLSDADGAMLEPLGVAVHAVDLGHLRLGASVAVVGCGPIGLMLLQVARAAGAARVVAVDPLPHRLEVARRLGADLVVDPQDVPDPQAYWRDVAGLGVDVAFEVAGNDDAVAMCVAAARPGARVVLVGIPGESHTSFPASPARRKGLSFVLSRRMKEVYPRATDLVVQGRVDVSSLVSDRFGLDRAREAFEAAVARKGLKVVVEPTRSSQHDRAGQPGRP